MANKAIGTLAVGSSVYLNVGGVRKEFLVVHQGLPSSLYDASCDGTWLLMKDCYENRQWNSSESNVYETSTVNTYLNGPFLSLFDSNIQGIIKQVKIPYRTNGGSGGTDQSGANGLSVKIFPLSGYEVGWTTDIDPYLPVDGVKLAYFESGTSTSAQNKRIAYLNGSAVDWWLRSVNGYSATSAWIVDSSGGYGVRGVSASLGILPALVLPSDTLVDDSGNVVTVDLTAHKTLVGGTAYTVKGGKCMVDGTVYNILKGRTLIDGTGWDITFPSAEPDVSKTWRFNDAISCWDGMTWNVNFVALGYPCTSIYSTYNNNLVYTTPSLGSIMARDAAGNWNGEEYRTVTFDEAPSGDLLTWLQANATPQ